MLIVEGNRSNDLVENKRGKKFRNLDLPIDFKSANESEQESHTDENCRGDGDVFFNLVVDAEDSDE